MFKSATLRSHKVSSSNLDSCNFLSAFFNRDIGVAVSLRVYNCSYVAFVKRFRNHRNSSLLGAAVTIDKGAKYKTSQEQVNAKNTQHRDEQLSYFANVSSNVTNKHPASVLIVDLSPWRHGCWVQLWQCHL